MDIKIIIIFLAAVGIVLLAVRRIAISIKGNTRYDIAAIAEWEEARRLGLLRYAVRNTIPFLFVAWAVFVSLRGFRVTGLITVSLSDILWGMPIAVVGGMILAKLKLMMLDSAAHEARARQSANKPAQHNAGSRPPSADAPASESPSESAPRG